LSDILAAAKLEGFLDQAVKWGEDNGAYEAKELFAKEVIDDFCKDIGLKRLEILRLKRELAALEAPSSSGSGVISYQENAADQRRLYPGDSPVVRNTFVDFPLPSMNAQKAHSVPPGINSHWMREQEINGTENADDEEDEEEDEEEGGDDLLNGMRTLSSPSSTRLSADLGDKTKTHDPFEDAMATSASSSQAVHADPMWGDQVPMVGMPFPPMMMGPYGPMMMPGMLPYGMMPMDPSMLSQPYLEPTQMPAAADPKPRAQVLERCYSIGSQSERIRWTFDSRKLKTTDREAVSPPFNVSCGEEQQCQFKMVLKPKAVDTGRGGACFKKSRGKGYIILRCTSEVAAVKPTLTFRVRIMSNRREESFRGPVRNNFADRAMCGLPEGQDEWDFNKVVDKETNTFVVVLELLKDDS
jgi:hypothetical protein